MPRVVLIALGVAGAVLMVALASASPGGPLRAVLVAGALLASAGTYRVLSARSGR